MFRITKELVMELLPHEITYSWASIIATLLLATCIYNIIIIFRRIYFHPLSRFPGPRIAAGTRWYEFYYDFFVGEGGQYFRKIEELHKQYGAGIQHVSIELWTDFSRPHCPDYSGGTPS